MESITIFLQTFGTLFSQYIRMNHLAIQHNKNKQLNNTQKDRALKAKNNPLVLEKYFRPITVSINDIHNFERKNKS